MPGRQHPARIDPGLQIALHLLADLQVLGGDQIRDFEHRRKLRRPRRIEEIEIIQPRLGRPRRRHPLDHIAVAIDIDPQIGPQPAPDAAIDAGVSGRGHGEHHLPLNLGPIVGDHDVGVELRMHHRQVVALQIVLHIGLPVAADPVRASLHQRQVRHSGRPARRQRGQGGLQPISPLAKVDEHQPAPDLHADREQAEGARVEPRQIAKVRRRPQPPVQRIAPAVVAAGERLAAISRTIRHQRASPMPTDIVEPGQSPVRLPHHHHRRAADHIGDVVSGARQLADMADELPRPSQDRSAVGREGVRSLIEGGR